MWRSQCARSCIKYGLDTLASMPIGRLLLIPPDEDVGASRTCLLEYLANRSMGETGAMTLFPFGLYLYLGGDSSTAPQPLSLNVAWMPSSFVAELFCFRASGQRCRQKRIRGSPLYEWVANVGRRSAELRIPYPSGYEDGMQTALPESVPEGFDNASRDVTMTSPSVVAL
ncbi:hypothetical protein JMJ77_0000966 [Colletotrichum scovillei]|uniref:Uncharacterized protein n=1 Tax=Colletotrichum scovillei TaxID=1209932 RepID=A0A9P7UHU7_9PEZI|nr:hypothetical protein JMJ77_0000966 [Colletotrichum scovillei]KAG7072183.1 hypothetical protein JMJ76_0005042 [Colletotrichum scovillei]KAG7080528.1 hypothetical protein JMJ78_0007622 [Colletotrichum scovillei]